jgi:hypothetical protein
VLIQDELYITLKIYAPRLTQRQNSEDSCQVAQASWLSRG